MKFLSLIFDACLKLPFLDVETNPDPRRHVSAVCRILCSNVRGLAGNLSDQTMVSSQYNILLCTETLVSDMRQVSEFLVPGFGRPVSLCRAICLELKEWLRTYKMVTDHFAKANLNVVPAKCCFLRILV